MSLVLKDGREPAYPGARRPAALRDTMRSVPVSFAIDGRARARAGDRDRAGPADHRRGRGGAAVADGHVVADPERDLAKIAVIERHHATGRVGLGLVRGFGLTAGAFASTVAHDAHNLVVVGVYDEDMALCAARAQELGGGLVVARDGAVRGELPLPIAGLLSDAPLEEVAEGLERLQDLLREQGVEIGAPFMTLSFLALSVIPSLKITDRGLVDVDAFAARAAGAQRPDRLRPRDVRGALRRAVRALAVGGRAGVAAGRLRGRRRVGRGAAARDVRGVRGRASSR